MTIGESLKQAIDCLKLHKTGSPTLDAEVILSFVLKKDKAFIYTHPEKLIASAQQKKLHNLITKRARGFPVAYLTGHKEFFGLDFEVNKNVLIPRPETEALAEAVLSVSSKRKTVNRILDVGTGSGCVIISIAKAVSALRPPPSVLFFASDISPKALAVAKQNAKRHGVKINFKTGSLLKPWENHDFDIIVANLPYGWSQWKNNSSAETKGLKFEPKQALFTQAKGLALYWRLFKQISTLNPQPSSLFFEFDPRQTTELKKLASKYLPKYKLKIIKDLSRNNRVAVLTKKLRN